MSAVLAGASFPEPGNSATMLTLDVASSQPGMNFFVFVRPRRFSFTGTYKENTSWPPYSINYHYFEVIQIFRLFYPSIKGKI